MLPVYLHEVLTALLIIVLQSVLVAVVFRTRTINVMLLWLISV